MELLAGLLDWSRKKKYKNMVGKPSVDLSTKSFLWKISRHSQKRRRNIEQRDDSIVLIFLLEENIWQALSREGSDKLNKIRVEW